MQGIRALEYSIALLELREFHRTDFCKGGVQVPECLSAFCLPSALREVQVPLFRAAPCQLPKWEFPKIGNANIVP